MNATHPPPPDADKRLQLKEQLQLRMRQSIAEQGAFGVRQTSLWLKAYKLAQKCTVREWPTCSTLRRRIKALDDVLAWKVQP